MRSITAKLHTVLIRIIIIVLMLFMVSIGLRIVTRHVLIDRLGMDNAFTRYVFRDKPKLFIPDLQVAAGERARRGDGFMNKLEVTYWQYTTFVNRITNKLDTYMNEELVFRRPILEAANAYEKAIGWNLAGHSAYNNVIELQADYLILFSNWTDMGANTEAILEFKEYLDGQALPLLFVQPPGKVSKQDTVVNNVVDFYNDNADRLVGSLRDNGVNTLDLREQIEQQRLNHNSLFYNTDHHWRTEVGLWAAGEIGQELNRNFGFGFDPALFSPENYAFDIHKKAFLGSLGRKVTLARATLDDFVLIYPKFPVDLTLKIPSIELDITGGFDIIYDYSQLEIEDLYESDPYGMYMHSALTDHGLTQLTNNLAQGDVHKILVLGDSYINVVVPFLALGVNQIDIVDLRVYLGSLREWIQANSYDMVIIAYSAFFPVEYESGFSMYDFR